MACSKYTITNTGSTNVNYNYQNCEDNIWKYQVEITPSQTRDIFVVDNTFSTAYVSHYEIIIVAPWP